MFQALAVKKYFVCIKYELTSTIICLKIDTSFKYLLLFGSKQDQSLS